MGLVCALGGRLDQSLAGVARFGAGPAIGRDWGLTYL